jgi:L-lactate dehydrogenase complex protein LldF
VIETDLGEFIIQLRGEPPAHIITPAVHLRKEEVSETFHETLGTPATTDIPVMTAAARKRLRRYFLEADIGISGINFGVVESGTLCIVTNEGNGRMVTTLPPVHIALMGIERLVPSMKSTHPASQVIRMDLKRDTWSWLTMVVMRSGIHPWRRHYYASAAEPV